MFLKLVALTSILLIVGCGDSGSPQQAQQPDNTPTEEVVGSVQINELTSRNSIFDDEDGDSPDWIELYNTSLNPQSLDGWALTDDIDEPQKWLFPDINIGAASRLIVWASDKDRKAFKHYRTLVSTNSASRYLLPDTEVDNTWVQTDFDAGDWSVGTSAIGYGDDDDTTVVASGTTAVFARFEFTLSDPEQVNELLLNIDYDDGFVAYLNGVEVARDNLSGLYPNYSALAFTNREALLYQGQNLVTFDISTFKNALIEGDNVLAVQVHNVSAQSSDLTLLPILTAQFDEETEQGVEPPAFLSLNQGQLHTNFKISSQEAETIYLYNSSGELVDSLTATNISLNGSFGRSSTGEIGYFETPTPGQANIETIYTGVVTNQVQFSEQGGLTAQDVTVAISGAESNEVIRYTLDGSVPTSLSLQYTAPLNITENTILRAAVFRENHIPSPTQTESWLFASHGELPVISLAGDHNLLFDEQTGIYPKGPNALPDFPFFNANFWNDTEIPLHFSYYPSNGSQSYELDLGAKIFGGWSRGNDQRSFSLFARGRYGQSEFDYPFFASRQYSEFQSLVIRNSGQDWMKTMFRDALMTSLVADTGIDHQANQPAVVYINGDYWGLYNLREKVNEHFIASRHDVDPESIDIVEGQGFLVHGDNRQFQEMMAYVAQADASGELDYQYLSTLIDVENFARYQVAQTFFDNHDWPGNNIKVWRPKDGKWRWILYDTDFGFNLFPEWHEPYSFDSLSFATTPFGFDWPNPPWSTLLLRTLLNQPEFERLFVLTYADFLNTRFQTDVVIAEIEQRAAVIEDEVPDAFTRWLGFDLSSTWYAEIENVIEFAEKRPEYVWDHIANYFQFGQPVQLDIEISSQGGRVIINSIELESSIFSGHYFTEHPVSLAAFADDGYAFSHWQVGQDSYSDAQFSLALSADTQVQAVFIEAP